MQTFVNTVVIVALVAFVLKAICQHGVDTRWIRRIFIGLRR